MKIYMGPFPGPRSRKKRRISVRIDPYDTWGMDSTLADLIIPMLRQLRATKHGAPFVDDEDVPEGLGLRKSEAPPLEKEWDVDENHFKRWDWVLDEMIWCFEQEYLEENEEGHWEYYDRYADGEPTEPEQPIHVLEEDGTSREEFLRFGDQTDEEREAGRRARGKFNSERYKAYRARLQKGFTLFGRYFQDLWD